MKSNWILISGLVVIALLAGCAGSQKNSIYASRLKDVNAGNYELKIGLFNRGETPAVVVTGVKKKNVQIKVYNLDTGKEVATGSDFIEKGQAKWWVLSDLTAGKYQAVLLVEGENKGVTDFEVYR